MLVMSWKNQRNGESPIIHGNVGEMHQFPIIRKPIWSSRRFEKLRNALRTRLSIDAQAVKPLWLHLAPPKRLASSFPSLIL